MVCPAPSMISDVAYPPAGARTRTVSGSRDVIAHLDFVPLRVCRADDGAARLPGVRVDIGEVTDRPVAQSLPIRRVRDRLFRGFCPDQINRGPEAYESVYAIFLEKREEIYESWRNQEGLEEDRVEDTLEYFDDFYDILSDPRKIQREMMSTCRRLG